MFRGSDNFVKAFLFVCYGNQASFPKKFLHILLLDFFRFPFSTFYQEFLTV